MKYYTDGFRPLYHNFCVFPLEKGIATSCQNFPGFEDAFGIVTYGFCEDDGELAVEALCCVKDLGNGKKQLCDIPDQRCVFLIDSVERIEFQFLGYGDDKQLMSLFGETLESRGLLDVDEMIEETRNCRDIDEFRDKHYIDHVVVVIDKEGLEKEEMWAEVYSITNNRVNARLLDEPYQDYGFHRHNSVSFSMVVDPQGKRRLYANLTGLEPETDEEDGDEFIMTDLEDDDDTFYDELDYEEGMYLGMISKDGVLKVCAEVSNEKRYEFDKELDRIITILASPVFEFDLEQTLDPEYEDLFIKNHGLFVCVDCVNNRIFPYQDNDDVSFESDPFEIMTDRSILKPLFKGEYKDKDDKFKTVLASKLFSFTSLVESKELGADFEYFPMADSNVVELDDDFYEKLENDYRKASDEAFDKVLEFSKKQKALKYVNDELIVI